LGEIIRRQRELSEMSMRQFSELVGISNPYLSQIERGLREPSERVVDAIAQALRTTTDALYEQAGIAPEDEVEEGVSVPDAIRADERLTTAERRALLGVYQAFVEGRPRRPRRRRTAAGGPAPATATHVADEEPPAEPDDAAA
jgi:transcriptional regulator with XRE-family HTH domain